MSWVTHVLTKRSIVLPRLARARDHAAPAQRLIPGQEVSTLMSTLDPDVVPPSRTPEGT